MTRIFISYAAAQADVAVQLYDKLTAAGYEAWVFAVHGDSNTNTDDVMQGCDMQVVIMDSKATTSPNVRIEIKRFHTAGKPIIPLMLEPLMLPDEIDSALAVYNMDDLDDTAARLIDQIEKVLADRAENIPTGMILLSYPRSQAEFAAKLNRALEAAGYNTWFYADDYDPRRNRDDQIPEVIQQAAMQIVVVTRRTVDLYGGMRMEFEAMAIMGKPIIPVMLYPIVLPKELRKVAAVDFTGNFDTGMMNLKRTVDAVLQPATEDTSGKRVIVAYHDLTAEGVLGPSNAARTITDYLNQQQYEAEAVDFSGASFDYAMQRKLDTANTLIVVLSVASASFLANADDTLHQSLSYVTETHASKTRLAVKISRDFTLSNPALEKHAQTLMRLLPRAATYIPPVYLPPENAEKPLARLLEQLEDDTTGKKSPVAAPEAPVVPTPEPGIPPLKGGLTHHIFLSYKRMDGETMRRVRDDLRKQGFVVWTDELIEKGTPQWQREIERAIRNTATLVCLLSPEAAQSDYVREELAAAKMFRKPIFMAIIRGTREECFIYGFVNAQSTDLRTAETYTKEFPLLAAAIKRRL
ncbi:MAG: toll/interleukin-1 receptor domain-containing protein [Chloroflexota bacterium]